MSGELEADSSVAPFCGTSYIMALIAETITRTKAVREETGRERET
jgi:hypothetical protein